MRNWYAGILRSVGKIMRRFDTLQMELSEFFYLQYKPFGSDSRNIRFAFSTDGMNLFGENRTVHSTWPVILAM
jgi:hypothetical protein